MASYQGALRKIFPKAPEAVIAAFVSDEGRAWLAKAGISDSSKRMAVAFAHCHAETAGFSIRNLTENINYSAERMAAVWPNRFPNAAAVRVKYGTGAGWQKKAIDDIYGNRMGNRPGTSDGSSFIGRGGPQITGRDGYREVGRRAELPLEENPELACRPENQPRILAAFWMWKNLGPLADRGGIDATVRPWNGGTNGLAERKRQFARIMPIIDGVTVPAPPDIEPVPPKQPGFLAAFFSVLLALFKRN